MRRAAAAALVVVSAACGPSDGPAKPATPPAAAPPGAGGAATFVIAGATVLDGAGGTREGATVAVRDGKVTLAGASGGRRVDATGAYLTPGLVDAAGRAGFASFDAEMTREMTADLDAGDLADPRSRAFREAAQAGCTAVRLVPGPQNVAGGLSRTFVTWTPGGEAAPLPDAPQALCLSLSGEASAGNFPPRFGATDSIYARRPGTRMGVVWMLRQTFLAARGDASRDPPPEHREFADALLGRRPCLFLSHRWQDVSAALRVADEVGLRDVAIAGCEEAYLGREDLARRDVAAIVGPFPHERRGEGPDSTDTALSNAAMLRAAGVRVALTAGALGGRALREQAMLAVRHGMSRDDALAAVTSVPADLCGLAGRGRIAEGAPADLVLWSGHPLVPSSRPLLVLVDGVEIDLDDR